MADLSGARAAAWAQIQALAEQLALGAIDPRRRAGGVALRRMGFCRDALAAAERAAERAARTHRGLVGDLWMRRYGAVRTGPLAEELARLEARLAEQDPEGYAATAG